MSTSKKKQERPDDLQLEHNNINIRNSINVYTEDEELRKESNQHSKQINVPLHTESDLMDIKIIEDLNPPKESDTIDLTNLDDEKEHNSGEQDKPKTNKKRYMWTQKHKKK